MTSRGPTVVLAAALLVGALGATGAHAADPRAPTRATKIVKGVGSGSWVPATVRISSGGTIKWKAVSNSHTVTAYGGGWHLNRSLTVGNPVTFRFTQPGTYRFRCTFHSTLANGVCSGMCGKVVVASG